jgi:hypothetical protein
VQVTSAELVQIDLLRHCAQQRHGQRASPIDFERSIKSSVLLTREGIYIQELSDPRCQK